MKAERSGMWIINFNALLSFMAVLLLGSGCSPFVNGKKEGLKKLDKSNYVNLSGTYDCSPTVSKGKVKSFVGGTNFGGDDLWSIFEGHANMQGLGINTSTTVWSSVTLDVLSSKRIRASLFVNDSLVERIKLKGKIKNGYFYRRKYFIAIPLVPLAFGYKGYRYRIGLIDDSLVVDYHWKFMLFVISAGTDGKGRASARFARM